MGVNRKAWNAKGVGKHYVGSLPAYAWKTCQAFNVLGDFPRVFALNYGAGLDDVLALGAKVAALADKPLKFKLLSGGEFGGVAETLEEARRD